MLETTKPLNVYCNSESGYDSLHVSGESSRRNSIGFKEFVKTKRFPLLGKTNRVTTPAPLSSDGSRRTSSSDSTSGGVPDEIDEQLSPRPLYQRRMSVPEKVFLNADYAILRPSMEADIKYEIVAAFDRYTDPYRHYMQSLTCYDLQPIHSAVVVIDGKLKIHKALTALSQCGHQVAIVSNLDVKGGLGIITVTDCLKAIVLASEGVQEVAEQTVAEFLKLNNRKQLVTADVNTSVWDAAKMICLNRIHRIPIVHFDELENGNETKRQQGNLLYVLSLKTVFTETIVKLSDPKPSLCSHIKQKTVSERRVGTWSGLHTVILKAFPL
ncbi:CBS domain protein [Dictyocaulus viviparus]|uniref:CBS domain protein n=1 Tax=Dictyocaulus viviparus TaxID=29172 RepID=A0A0D8XED8_DICVI|nr:CBS domain protein [Dictyocaulus viviparus]